LTLADYFQKEMKGLFFPLLAKNVENIEFVSKQNHCKFLNVIALVTGHIIYQQSGRIKIPQGQPKLSQCGVSFKEPLSVVIMSLPETSPSRRRDSKLLAAL